MKLIVASLLLACAIAPARAEEFELKDGDKVVWLGSTLIEREQRYGYWETALTARWPDRKMTFRNLGWSGDNVYGEARLGFDINTPALGLKRMVDLTLAEKPTVIFICYGQNESFDGEAGLAKFVKGYEKLLDELKPAKARIVLMTPLPFISCPPMLPDATAANKRLDGYAHVVRTIAERRQLPVADLFVTAGTEDSANRTENGLHLTELGYARTARFVWRALGLPDLPGPPPADAKMKIEQLRQAIIEKNKLYFYRWRPQNETYLFGFRKKEQGKNAKEIAEFDPLIEKAEAEIDRLKKPRTHKYELVPAEKK